MRFESYVPDGGEQFRPGKNTHIEEKCLFVGQLVIPVADVMRELGLHPIRGEQFVAECLRALQDGCAVLVDQMLASGEIPTHGAAFYLGNPTFEPDRPTGTDNFFCRAPVMLAKGLMRFDAHAPFHMRNQPSDLVQAYYSAAWGKAMSR